jgi:ankyrin repeat protein
MAKTALDAGADPNHDRKMPNNQNLAFWAVHYNQPEILKALLDHGADPSPKISQGDTALSHAQKFHPELVPILESHVK